MVLLNPFYCCYPLDFILCNCMWKNNQSLLIFFHLCSTKQSDIGFGTTWVNDNRLNPILLLLAFFPYSFCFSHSFMFCHCVFHISPHSDESLTPTVSFVSSLTLLFILFCSPFFWTAAFIPFTVLCSSFVRLHLSLFPFLLSSCFLFAASLVGQFFIISFFPSFSHASALSVPILSSSVSRSQGKNEAYSYEILNVCPCNHR